MSARLYRGDDPVERVGALDLLVVVEEALGEHGSGTGARVEATERRRDADRRARFAGGRAHLFAMTRQEDHSIVDAARLQDGGEVPVDVVFDRLELVRHAAGVVEHEDDVDGLFHESALRARHGARLADGSAARASGGLHVDARPGASAHAADG